MAAKDKIRFFLSLPPFLQILRFFSRARGIFRRSRLHPRVHVFRSSGSIPFEHENISRCKYINLDVCYNREERKGTRMLAIPPFPHRKS